MPVSGFVSPGGELPEDEVEEELHALTFQTYELPPITRGVYILNEENLPETYKELLHGRAYVIDREEITETDSASARTYYIAADKVQGLVVPARSMSINSENGTIYYRFTDNGEHWTNWITLPDSASDSYLQQEQARFAEIQVYTNIPGTLLSIRGTR